MLIQSKNQDYENRAKNVLLSSTGSTLEYLSQPSLYENGLNTVEAYNGYYIFTPAFSLQRGKSFVRGLDAFYRKSSDNRWSCDVLWPTKCRQQILYFPLADNKFCINCCFQILMGGLHIPRNNSLYKI